MNNKGFTLIETIFVMTILSLILLVTMHLTVKTLEKVTLNDGVKDFETKLEYLETLSIARKKPILVWFTPNARSIKYQIERNKIETLSIYDGRISKYNKLTTVVYDGHGNINKFGTLKLSFKDKNYKVIFRIEKGRYIIVEE